MTPLKFSHPPILAVLLGLLTVLYIGLLLLAPAGWLPGDPVWAIRPATVQEILDESLNFFFVLPLLNRLGFSALPAASVHPTLQALFNFAEGWIFMFLPILSLDPRGRKLPTLFIWSLAMFLTNVFLLPYMALRLCQAPELEPIPKGKLAKLFGAIGFGVGLLAVGWGIWVDPASGGYADRWAFLGNQVLTNRLTLAFWVDLVLFYGFQIWLMGAIIPPGERSRPLRLIPFWGLALWLML
ncbi:hypothetical protein [Lyngbya confervoides]|uniref:Uncharacterized protein n=1 Tax=Lyngbya confervoides BDU141951 TaxID=1574623 RepID=A0ABD4TA70_9CYAN|nr:hypothetical protein [Lyngbya confervoides]MCM1985253.1 hypothetical protein [Lyngbya confervoides BDU141951]